MAFSTGPICLVFCIFLRTTYIVLETFIRTFGILSFAICARTGTNNFLMTSEEITQEISAMPKSGVNLCKQFTSDFNSSSWRRILRSAHYVPRSAVSSLKLLIAATLIEYTLSFNHDIHIGISFSVKKDSPSCLAKVGYCSTTDSLILQFLSSLRSLSAGTIDYYRFSKPITQFKSSSLLNKFKRTSDDSSLSKAKKIGNTCSLVGPFSIIGHIANKFSASACLT